MSKLAEEISKLTNPLPEFEDPEDVQDETSAKLLSRGDDLDESEYIPSKLRSRAAAIQVEDDAKYSGRRISRKKIMDHESDEDDMDVEDSSATDDDDDFPSDDGGSDNDEDVIRSDEEDEQLMGFKEKMKFHEAQASDTYYDEEEEEEDDEDDEEESEGDDEEDSEGQNVENEEDGLKKFTKVNIEEEVQKGKAVRAQLGIWDSLLEGRIKLQKALVIVNQLPQPDLWQQFVDKGGPEYNKALDENENALRKLLDQLIELQTTLLVQNPDTKQLVDSGGQSDMKSSGSMDDEDEEITSDSELDEKVEALQPQLLPGSLKRKLKLKPGQYPDFLAKRHKTFLPYRNSTIQKWYDKTRIASGRLSKGFSAFDQSAVRQIEQILADKDRLIKRTQLRRSAYKVLGKQEPEPHKSDPDDENLVKDNLPVRNHLQNYDEEIFDDDDFYHQQLRELIERKTADINDPIALTRQWLEIQKLRNKKKKVVDTKASKGRKIRYDIHKKLVNFMAPYDNLLWSDEAKNELYGSLFGKIEARSEAVR